MDDSGKRMRWYCEEHNQWCCLGCGVCPESDGSIDKTGAVHSSPNCPYFDLCPDCKERLIHIPGGWLCQHCERSFDWYVDGKRKTKVVPSVRKNKHTHKTERRCRKMQSLSYYGRGDER